MKNNTIEMRVSEEGPWKSLIKDYMSQRKEYKQRYSAFTDALETVAEDISKSEMPKMERVCAYSFGVVPGKKNLGLKIFLMDYLS